MLFDRKMLKLRSLDERIHDMDLSSIKERHDSSDEKLNPKWIDISKKIFNAKRKKSVIIFMFGAHVIRSGMQKYIIDLMERGYLTCLSTNGSGMIHDYELSLIGATTESVAKYIKEGQFGLWQETGGINDIINRSFAEDPSIGMGEAVGKAIHEGEYPHKEISLFASAYRLNIPITVHVGIGYDIIHEHPNCNGAATGALSYNDFLKYALMVQKLENGVVMDFGSAVMAPEVFLKALSMARNVAHQDKTSINHFTAVVCDIRSLPESTGKEFAKATSEYYFRPHKTMLVRTIADGGEGFYISGEHKDTIPELWRAINSVGKNESK
jgi:hypothetical protein